MWILLSLYALSGLLVLLCGTNMLLRFLLNKDITTSVMTLSIVENRFCQAKYLCLSSTLGVIGYCWWDLSGIVCLGKQSESPAWSDAVRTVSCLVWMCLTQPEVRNFGFTCSSSPEARVWQMLLVWLWWWCWWVNCAAFVHHNSLYFVLIFQESS